MNTHPTLDDLQQQMARTGGTLDLSGTAITALPEGLTVGGGLDLRGTAITALPGGLTVGGWLDLRGNGVAYSVKLNSGQMQIGCENHPIAFWRALDDRRAIEMDGKNAVKFWSAWGAELIRWHDAKFARVPA